MRKLIRRIQRIFKITIFIENVYIIADHKHQNRSGDMSSAIELFHKQSFTPAQDDSKISKK